LDGHLVALVVDAVAEGEVDGVVFALAGANVLGVNIIILSILKNILTYDTLVNGQNNPDIAFGHAVVIPAPKQGS
jgi:hypothetical protein